jgi:hypothetical protein
MQDEPGSVISEEVIIPITPPPEDDGDETVSVTISEHITEALPDGDDDGAEADIEISGNPMPAWADVSGDDTKETGGNGTETATGMVSSICRITPEGTEECSSFGEITVGVDGITAEPVPEEIREITEAEVKPKHLPLIWGDVAEAIDKALAAEPEMRFHLIVGVWYEKSGNETFFDSGRISRTAEGLISDFGAVVRKTDDGNGFIFAELPANVIDSLAESELNPKEIRFDPEFEPPVFEDEPAAYATTAAETVAIEETTSVSAEVMVNNKIESVKISKDAESGSILVSSNGITAETTAEIKIDEEGFKLAEMPLETLPDMAVQEMQDTIKTAVTKEIELKIVEETPKYEIKAVQKTRFLGFIPMDMEIKATVNAQTGDIESVEKPWWSFMVG